MQILSLLVKAAVVARIVLATPLARRWDDLEVKHAWVDIPAGWERHTDAPLDHVPRCVAVLCFQLNSKLICIQ